MLKNSMISGPKCPSCGNKKIVTDQNTGELFCGKCGLVITDKIADTGAEWRSFSNDEGNRTRVGAGTSLTMHDMGLSTINWHCKQRFYRETIVCKCKRFH